MSRSEGGMHRGETPGEGVTVARVAGWLQLRHGGEASCISQICRVIKLIKRLTHLTLFLFLFRFISTLSLSLFSTCFARTFSRKKKKKENKSFTVNTNDSYICVYFIIIPRPITNLCSYFEHVYLILRDTRIVISNAI